MSAWSMKFKKRMLQLRLAFKDYETGEVVLGNYGEIHDHVLGRLNDARNEKGLKTLDYNKAYKKGRGYIRKDTEEFMPMEDAIEWASATGYGETKWSGESIALRGRQVDMGGKKYWG